MGYWDATDEILRRNGGEGTTCPHCGQTMFPVDDHGRFSCFCGGGRRRGRGIPQIDVTGMTDEQREAIAPIYRLNDTMTPREQAEFDRINRLHGMGPYQKREDTDQPAEGEDASLDVQPKDGEPEP